MLLTSASRCCWEQRERQARKQASKQTNKHTSKQTNTQANNVRSGHDPFQSRSSREEWNSGMPGVPAREEWSPACEEWSPAYEDRSPACEESGI